MSDLELARFGAEIRAAVRAIDPSPAFVDEIAQRVRVRLLVADDGPPRIARYQGKGTLGAWVAVAAQRIALDDVRARRPAAGEDVLADLVDREPDPALRHLKTAYAREYREALAEALTGASDRARAVLGLSVSWLHTHRPRFARPAPTPAERRTQNTERGCGERAVGRRALAAKALPERPRRPPPWSSRR